MPSVLFFSQQAVGTSSAAQQIILNNSGSATLFVAKITAAGDFAEKDNCPTGMAPRTSCTIQVTFTPIATGTRSGSVTIGDSASGAPRNVPITGLGVSNSASSATPAFAEIAAFRKSEMAKDEASNVYSSAPLAFEKNEGQFRSPVEFVARAERHSIGIGRHSIGDRRDAPLFYVSPGQINFEVPEGTAPGSAFITIRNTGLPDNNVYLPIQSVAPALFSANADGVGPASGFAIHVKPDGTQVYQPLSVFDGSSQKAIFSPIDLSAQGAGLSILIRIGNSWPKFDRQRYG